MYEALGAAYTSPKHSSTTKSHDGVLHIKTSLDIDLNVAIAVADNEDADVPNKVLASKEDGKREHNFNANKTPKKDTRDSKKQ